MHDAWTVDFNFFHVSSFPSFMSWEMECTCTWEIMAWLTISHGLTRKKLRLHNSHIAGPNPKFLVSFRLYHVIKRTCLGEPYMSMSSVMLVKIGYNCRFMLFSHLAFVAKMHLTVSKIATYDNKCWSIRLQMFFLRLLTCVNCRLSFSTSTWSSLEISW